MDCTGRGTRTCSAGLLGLLLVTAVLLAIVLLDGQPAGAQAEPGSETGYGEPLGSDVGLEGDNLAAPVPLTGTETAQEAQDVAGEVLRELDEPLDTTVLAQLADARSVPDRSGGGGPAGQSTDITPDLAQVALRESQTRVDGLPSAQDDAQPEPASGERTAVPSTGTAAPGYGAEAGVQVAQVVDPGDGEAGDGLLAEQSGRVVPAVFRGDADRLPVVLAEAVYDTPDFYSEADFYQFVEIAKKLREYTQAGSATWQGLDGSPKSLIHYGESGTVYLSPLGDDKKRMDANTPILYQIHAPNGKLLLDWKADKLLPGDMEKAYADAVYPLYQDAFRTTHEKSIGQLKELRGKTEAGQVTWQVDDQKHPDRVAYSGESGSVDLRSSRETSEPPITFKIVGPQGKTIYLADRARSPGSEPHISPPSRSSAGSTSCNRHSSRSENSS